MLPHLGHALKIISLLNNAYINELDLLCVFHLRSDYDAQMQEDEFIWNFSTAWKGFATLQHCLKTHEK